MNIKRLLLSLSLLGVVSCGEIDKDYFECLTQGGQECENNHQSSSSSSVAQQSSSSKGTISSSVSSVASSKPPSTGMNPFCIGTDDSRKHMLWKPVSDTSGNAVVVTDGKYKKEFLSVKAELKNGQFEELFWKPLKLWGNPDKDGDRQHWRSRNKCDKFKNKALIYADDGNQTCVWQLPGDACKRWE